MSVKDLISTLHPLERKTIVVLAAPKTVEQISSETQLQEIEVMRALQWLQNKGLVKISEVAAEIADLDANGMKYLEEGLPEKRLLAMLKDNPEGFSLETLSDNFSKEELNICIGVLKKKAAIEMSKTNDETIVIITDHGKKLIDKKLLEEEFLEKNFPLDISKLSAEERFAFESLKKRKEIIKTSIKKTKTAELTDLGKDVLKQGLKHIELIDQLSAKMLREKSWKGKEFRKYDIKINVPQIIGGKKHHYRAFLEDVRKKFIGLGFTEMAGPLVETAFWNMDALFMPQTHSARDIHDAYYVKEPKFAKDLPKELIERVKQAHENGFKTGSTGWRYDFDIKTTSKHVLRTQGTACSARILASKELGIPGKYFGICRCFRPDVVDAMHNSDFYQVEGIVVEEGLNIRHLFALLHMFAKEFANAEKVKIVPGYFPFTEPSATLYAKHPVMGWIELGGSGIFRPEMTKPLGIDVPVIAWGIGIDRIAMFKLGIKDIRELFSHDLQFLRNTKVNL